MEKYFLSLKPLVRGDYLIHKADCPFIPEFPDRKKIGEFDSPLIALTASVMNFGKASLCPFCSNAENKDFNSEPVNGITIREIPSRQAFDKIFFAGIN